MRRHSGPVSFSGRFTHTLGGISAYAVGITSRNGVKHVSVVDKHYRQCKRYMNRHVRIKTRHGTYTGTIVKVDGQKVYLRTAPPWTNGKVTVSFFPFLLPLVLFDLLAIVLLVSPKRF